jgi:Tfp pilus assembly protein FimT
MNPMSQSNQNGFSLFQGLFAVAILSVMFLSIAPLSYRMLGDRHVVAYTNLLVGELQQARRLAVNSMSPVSLCSSSNGQDCTQTPWLQGYIAFYDAGRPGVVDGDDRIVHTTQARKVPVRVVLNGADYIRFLTNGAVLADAASSGQRVSTGQSEQPSALASLLGALSPVSTAHAATPYAADVGSTAMAQPVAFLVCSGQIGRAIRVTAIGRLDTSTVACR